ncbi:MAG: ABC transporter ATP-binding protein, partial [Oscillospiraceae bacterium]|nr:ABC transporter ATP-binding protein [Oscillospiraceae bacterium]
MSKLLEVKNLSTSFFTKYGEVKAVNNVSFDLDEGEVLAIVGESGSGKSVTSFSIMQLIAKGGKVVNGEILFNGQDLTKLSDKEMTKIRGKEISMIFQDPMTCLNPVFSIGNQMEEVLKLHFKELSREQRKQRCLEMLDKVGIPNPEERLKQFPHELSGGMRQRVMIA